MPIKQWFRPPRLLLLLFVGTALALLAGLGWLGWSALQQESRLAEQAVAERLPQSADVVQSEVRQLLSDLDARLAQISALPREQVDAAASAFAETLGQQAVIVVFDDEAVDAYPAQRLPYRPAIRAADEPDPQMFAAGEASEFRDQDYDRAVRYYRQFADSHDPQIRAAALLRIARSERAAGRLAAVLAIYRDIEALGPIVVSGRPADLLARDARVKLLKDMGRREELVNEGTALLRDLHRGRWPLSADSHQVYVTATQEALGPEAAAVTPDPAATALAGVVAELWISWQERGQVPDGLPQRSFSFSFGNHPVVVLALQRADRFVALVGGRGFLQERIIAPIAPVLERQQVGIALESGEGRTIVTQGVTSVSTQPVVRTILETGLPWTLRIVPSASTGTNAMPFLVRRNLLTAGIALIALLVVAGTYFSARAISREMEAARLQSDFVAAVSHEFRTPLTLLRQFTDLLAEGRVTSEEERARYYATLQRGTRRLTRLVEDLLDFGRMEAGSHGFKMKTVHVRGWLERIVGEFQEEMRAYHLEFEWDAPDDLQITADETTMGRALWNLLDNAAKYSPASKTIWVRAGLEGRHLAISVRDRGIGVPEGQRSAIFRKFVRGSMPEGHVIKGTGLGLAMVDQIMKAHGGAVRLDDTSPQGSTFSLVLPAQVHPASAAHVNDPAAVASRRAI